MMGVYNRLMLLCGFAVILDLLQGSAASGCTSEVYTRPLILQIGCKYNNDSLPWKGGVQFSFHNCIFNSGLAPVYILINLIPLMVYFPLLILFNINLASGPAQSFIFFYQVLSAAIPLDQVSYASFIVIGGSISGLLVMQNLLNDLLFPRRLPYLVLQYCSLVAVVVAIVMTLVLVKGVHCPCASWRRPWAKVRRSVRNFREKCAQKGTVLNGLCSIATLAYGFVIQQSFIVLQPTKYCSSGVKYCAFYCNEWNYTSSPEYRPFIAGAVISLVLVLPLPLLLLYYPCVPALMQRITKSSSPLITCHKLAPVFDVFQSAYKPKLRFFAAFLLFYRFVIWMMFSFLSIKLPNERQLIITLVFILILAIHSVIQPYSKPRHNYIEALYLVNLALISVIVTSILHFNFQVKVNPDSDRALFIALSVLPHTLAFLPMLIGAGFFTWKCKYCKKCRAACCKKRILQNKNESAEDEIAQLPMSEAYLDMSELVSKETPEF